VSAIWHHVPFVDALFALINNLAVVVHVSSTKRSLPRRPIQAPRGYQQELLDQAIKENVIVFLDTGAGKTLIAVLLIKVWHSHAC
jgi:superfamily II DNA or RNA helicase